MTRDTTEPAPIAERLRAILDAMPGHVRRSWESAGCPVERYDDDPAQVRAEVLARRRETWAASVPAAFAGASLEGLSAAQDPGGRVSGWLDSGAPKLLLVGDVGTGKTHAAYAVANAAAHTGEWVMLWRVPDLIRELQPGAEQPDRTYRLARDCGLLVLDDFGAEMVTDWRLEQLWRIVDHRTTNRRRMVVTTNLPYNSAGFKDTPEEARPVTPNLVDTYGLRLVDRLIDGAVAVRYVGRSLRVAAPW